LPFSLAELRDCVDQIVCLETPADFVAVGAWYSSFAPVSDAEVLNLLAAAAQ
jgi:putative phosphoribosyl transferase